MIRKYKPKDTDAVLDVWLKASVEAHNFISPEFWESQLDNMRNIYLPSSETYTYERQTEIAGFYSLNGHSLAALFVYPHLQGQGIGKQLLSHAKSKQPHLTLAVYKENVDPTHQRRTHH
ncbi:GNAT family N-acetyltransferase [uncultured Microbulbifer sp.]|uniref:GNAT family N-acetyltransferase n=1 Tax=uncultured Microbulbifer sp. TaxID=348147 RepID=UPI00262C6739|nr:GNAT family N-acetyltransferase [uncultured Microbulbifer sp.]